MTNLKQVLLRQNEDWSSYFYNLQVCNSGMSYSVEFPTATQRLSAHFNFHNSS